MSKASDCECGITLVNVLLRATREAAKWGWASATRDILYTLETGVPGMENKVVTGFNSDCDTGLNPETFIRLRESSLRGGIHAEEKDAAAGLFLTLLESAVGYLEDCESVRKEQP